MKKTLIVTTLIVVFGGIAVNEAYKAFNNSPLGTLKKLNDRKETIEKAIEDPTTLIKQPELKLQ
tara:strand:- start:251 stop:442 length:192 start_codon:yes stop_codon:yes gene_type:complete